MSAVPNSDCWGVVIDTDTYAGDFERELCAWTTGQVGECGVGEEYAFEYIAAKFTNVTSVADDNGCFRPASIFEDSEGVYNSVIIFFSTAPTQEQIDMIKHRCASYHDNDVVGHTTPFNILGYKLVECKVTKTIKDI